MLAESPIVQTLPSAHRREHSLEMQLPFLRRVHPDLPIVPVLIGFQTRATIDALADAIAGAFGDRRALLIASTDLSHYFDAETAATLDGRVQRCVSAFDADGLLDLFEQYPEHERGRYVACGGGAAIAVMKAARAARAPARGGSSSTRIRERCRVTTTASSATWRPRSAAFHRCSLTRRSTRLSISRVASVSSHGDRMRPSRRARRRSAGRIRRVRHDQAPRRAARLPRARWSASGLAAEVARCAADAASEDPRSLPSRSTNCRSCRSKSRCSVRSSRSIRPRRRDRHRPPRPRRRTGTSARPAAAAGGDRMGLDREQFLRQTCLKAGLPPDAWQHGARISRFDAEVFGD